MSDRADGLSFPMSNRNFLSKVYVQKMGFRSRTAIRHEVDHKKAMRLYKRGLSDLNIADLMGVSKGDVFRWRQENHMPSNMRKRKYKGGKRK